ncbi:hypothetical protein EIP91_002449 [Steccherinum ochraceum]|uniref:Uncharacterized protein n=1 Tax=Steccherinum ochraceum TaxID=92696 RepID=A0A4R0RE60_9APHY|nr:hypothetical protein EIP91_002449 [Steccherinum ochraceum]
MGHRSGLLDVFPVELLFMIKDHIPEIDLRTHVCFSQVLGPASRTVYTDAYWEIACVKFGLSLVADEEEVPWREFAYEIIRRDGFCEHPQCGVRRLEQNFREMSKVYGMKDYSRETLMQVMDARSPGAFNNGFGGTNTLLANIDFNRNPHTQSVEDGILRITESQKGLPEGLQVTLSKHPIAYRSFATFAPTPGLQLVTLGGIPPLRNPMGVTVWDVYSAVQAKLDATDSIYRMNEYLRFVNYRRALNNCADDLTHLLNQLTTLRDFFYIFRWDGLYYAGQTCDDTPRFAFGFQTVRKVVKGMAEPQLIV